MRRGTGVWLAAQVLALSCSFLLSTPGTAQADPSDDTLTVYCLAPAHTAELVNAAHALDLTVPGNPPQVAAWRANDQADFDRACAALYAAQVPQPDSGDSGLFSELLPFLTALLGALLGFAATSWRDRVNEGKAVARELTQAIAKFHDATTAYLGSKPNEREAAEAAGTAARRELVDQLVDVGWRHHRWGVVEALINQLQLGHFAHSALDIDWAENTPEMRAHRKKLEIELTRARRDVLLVAAALSRPYRPHFRLVGGGARNGS